MRLSSLLPSIRRRPKGRGAFGAGCSDQSASLKAGKVRASQVPGKPFRVFALFSDPGGTVMPGPAARRRGPRLVNNEGSPLVVISGLYRTASTHAVYASQRSSRTNHARLASGCRPGSTGWPSQTTGFQQKVSWCLLHPLLLLQAFLGAITIHTGIPVVGWTTGPSLWTAKTSLRRVSRARDVELNGATWIVGSSKVAGCRAEYRLQRGRTSGPSYGER